MSDIITQSYAQATVENSNKRNLCRLKISVLSQCEVYLYDVNAADLNRIFPEDPISINGENRIWHLSTDEYEHSMNAIKKLGYERVR
jgi:hypothetical protein